MIDRCEFVRSMQMSNSALPADHFGRIARVRRSSPDLTNGESRRIEVVTALAMRR